MVFVVLREAYMRADSIRHEAGEMGRYPEILDAHQDF